MMVVVMMAAVMVPAVPPMMVMMPPMHFRGREREQRANGGEPQNFRELHECSPWVGVHVCAESLAATLYAI